MNLDGLPVVPEPSVERLTDRKLVDYRDHRERFLKWCLTMGKNPEGVEGYSRHTVKNRAYRTGTFYRWVWEEEGTYTTQITHAHADDYTREMAYDGSSASHKANTQKALKMLFRWRAHELGEEEWDPDLSFNDNSSKSTPRDYLTHDERQKIREAALDYGSIPSYNTVTPEERERWKTYLSQRFGKEKENIGLDDWERANGWKIPSIVWTSLDAGLRPVEVERARTSWIDIDNAVLRIPREDSAKNEGDWVVGLQRRTAEILGRWLNQRMTYDHYEGTDKLWLTREGNPYQTHSLKYILHRLCEIANIPTENREMTWYAIRHSVGTYMTREEGLAAAQSQLRHKSSKTTMKYDQAPVEDRRDALDRMG